MQQKLAVVLVGLIFVALFAPLGQQPYLYANWMNLGLFGAGFLLLGALLFRSESTSWRRDARALNLLLLVAYLVHQFEEHGIDATGTHYAFMAVANAQLGALAGCAAQSECPLNPENIFYVNTIAVWLFLTLVLVAGNRFGFANLCAAALLLVNAVVHIQAGILHRAYNPGLVTAVVIFIPLALYRYRVLLREDAAGGRRLAASIVWSILAHALLLLFAALIYGKHLLPQPLFPWLLLIWALLPFLILNGTAPAIQATPVRT
ncbi:MAG: HXXEE domain-containing protein [Gammaproteobacteria bacterium]